MPERLTLPNSEAANFIAHATASNDEQITSEPDDVSATREATLNNHERDQELAHLQKLLTSGVSGKKVVDSLSEFTHLSHQEIAIKLIEAGQGWSVVFNSDKFTGLNQEIAIKLVEAGWGWAAAANLDKFTGLNHQEIANKLIEMGKGGDVADNSDKFTAAPSSLLGGLRTARSARRNT